MMFCNSCGKEIKDGKHFCANCGTKAVTTEVIKCEHCGRPLEEGAKFCQGCGHVVQADVKTYCAYCGEKLEEGDRFCGKCGHPRGNNVVSSFVQKMGQNSGSGSTAAHDSPVLLDRVKSPLGIKYLILTGLLLLSFIFLLIPSFELELSEWYDFFYNDFNGSFSLVNPCTEDIEDLLIDMGGSDGEDLVTVFHAMGTVFLLPAILWFGLSIGFTVAPIFKNTLNKRRYLILQIYTAVSYIVSILFWSFFYMMAWSEEDCSVKMNFGFYLTIILLIASAVMSFVIMAENKKMTTNSQGGRA